MSAGRKISPDRSSTARPEPLRYSVASRLDAFDLAIEQHRTAERAGWDTASCPRAYPPNLGPERTFRDRLNTGDCLIAEAESTSPMEATVSFTTLYNRYRDFMPPAHAHRWQGSTGSSAASSSSVKKASAKPVGVVVRDLNDDRNADHSLLF
jgi:hypothetical protein